MPRQMFMIIPASTNAQRPVRTGMPKTLAGPAPEILVSATIVSCLPGMSNSGGDHQAGS